MTKYILLIFGIFSTINAMDEPDQTLYRKQVGRPFDMWQFFSPNNVLDKLAEPIPFWNEKMYHDQCSPETIAHLHILKHSSLATKGAVVLNANSEQRHITHFLSQQFKNVQVANGNAATFIYDLIVLCSSTTPEKFAQYHACLKPQGELFCLCTTRSNALPLVMKVFIDLCPKIKNAIPYGQYRAQDKLQMFLRNKDSQYHTDEEIQQAIANAQLTILSYEKKIFDIVINNKTEFKKFYKTFILENEHMRNVSSKKRGKLANQFVNQLTKNLKIDNDGNWFYPFETTAIHLRKTE